MNNKDIEKILQQINSNPDLSKILENIKKDKTFSKNVEQLKSQLLDNKIPKISWYTIVKMYIKVKFNQLKKFFHA